MRQRCFCALLGYIFLWLCGCAALPSPSLVSPSRVGRDLDVAAILDDLDSYHVFFSARAFNPSALLFVPNASPFVLVLEKQGAGQGWHPVEGLAPVKAMVARIRERDRFDYPVLRALLRPVASGVEATGADVLGYLFSARSTCARKLGAAPNMYKVYQVPEIPRLGERDEGGFWWRRGCRD